MNLQRYVESVLETLTDAKARFQDAETDHEVEDLSEINDLMNELISSLEETFPKETL